MSAEFSKSSDKIPNCNPQSYFFDEKACGQVNQITYDIESGCAYQDGQALNTVNGKECSSTLREMINGFDYGVITLSLSVTLPLVVFVAWTSLRRKSRGRFRY